MGRLQDKIQQTIDHTDMNYTELAYALGVSKDNLYKWKRSSKPRDPEEYEKLNKGLDRLLETPKSQVRDGKPLYQLEIKKEAGPLLVCVFLDDSDEAEIYANEKANPGDVIDIRRKLALILQRNDSQVIGNVHGLMTVTGDSMAPEYKSGSLMALSKLKYKKLFTPGNCYYIINKNKEGVLRRIKMAEEDISIELISENPDIFPSYIRNLDDILAIFRVEAVVTKQ